MSLRSHQLFLKNYYLKINDSNDTLDFKKSELNIYENLLWHGYLDLMCNIYPYCKILLAEKFNSICANFLRTQPPKDYHFNQIANGFSDYLAQYELELSQIYPYLSQLAKYEWTELECIEDKANTTNFTEQNINATLINYKLYLNPTLRLLNFDYPILRIAQKIKNKTSKSFRFKPKKTFLIAFRDAENYNCKFAEITQFGFNILKSIQDFNVTYQGLAHKAVSLNSNQPDKAIFEALTIMEKLFDIGAVLNKLELD